MSTRWAFFERVAAPEIDDPRKDHMVRWRLATPWAGICVHRINTADDTRPIPHTHPWPFLSLVIRGGYREHIERRGRSGRLCKRRDRTRRVGSVHMLRATDAHTLRALRRSPTWTLVLVGRRRPEPSWGYWQDDQFIPWNEHPYAEPFAAALRARATA